MKTIHLLAPVLCLAVAGLTGCTQRADEMEARLLAHDAQLRQMQPAQADAWNQVQAMRDEIRELKGQIADLKRAGGAAAIVDKLNRHDAALRQIETSLAMNFDLGESAGAPVVPAAPAMPVYGGLADASAATAGGAAAGAAAAAPAAPATPAAAPKAEAPVNPTAGTWGQATPRPEAPKVEKDMSVALYDAGINAFNARKYDSALRSFSDFMKNFSGNAKAPMAQYYLAECYFQKNQFADAALAYDTVINKYPKSARAPSAMLKQGICFSKMKNAAAAKARMNELIKKYPASPEAARAKDFLKNNK